MRNLNGLFYFTERGDVFNTNKYYSQLPLNLRQKNWSSEIQLDSIWADLNYDHGVVGLPQFQKYHYWGTPLWIGAALIKIKGCLLPKVPRLQVMFDNVQLEWSPPLSSFLNQVYRYESMNSPLYNVMSLSLVHFPI